MRDKCEISFQYFCVWGTKKAALLSQSELNKSEIEQIIILKQRENK